MNYKKEYPVIAAKFKAIAAETTTEDVMASALEVGCHYETVLRYLRGEVKKKKFGELLLASLKSRIENRQQVIN